MVPMVVKEFVRQRVAPLQRHSRSMWDLAGVEDPMRLQKTSLTAGTLSMVLELLTGESEPADLPGDGCLLYQCSNKTAFMGQMPLLNEWGLLPEGLEGPCENPFFVTLLLHAPQVWRQGGTHGEQLLRVAPEAWRCWGPGDRDSRGPEGGRRRVSTTLCSRGRGS